MEKDSPQIIFESLPLSGISGFRISQMIALCWVMDIDHFILKSSMENH
jgi:hypothetical protein